MKIEDANYREVIVRLKEEQDKSGYLTPEYLNSLAQTLSLPVNEIYGIASFYSFLLLKPVGRHVIRVCQSLPCEMKSHEQIIKSITEALGIQPGETTPDKRYTLELTNCIGACDMAPAMLVDDDLHGNLSPEKIKKVLEKYK